MLNAMSSMRWPMVANRERRVSASSEVTSTPASRQRVIIFSVLAAAAIDSRPACRRYPICAACCGFVIVIVVSPLAKGAGLIPLLRHTLGLLDHAVVLGPPGG